MKLRLQTNSNRFQNLMAGNFAAFQPTDLKFSALKDLHFYKTVSKLQEASSILRASFSAQSDFICIGLI